MYTITEKPITIEELVRVAREHEQVGISNTVIKSIKKSRVHVDRILASENPVYGITTGFGELSKIYIDSKDRGAMQRNLILSHCTGVGEYLSEDVVRAAILLRVVSLSKGYSGIRVETVQKLMELLNKNIYPAIPCKGSVGSSGDLAPLAHMAAVLLGEGLVIIDGKAVPAAPVLNKVNYEPIELAVKEGLALINGTQIMTAIAALVCYDAINLMKVSDIAASLSLEALRGTLSSFDPRIAMVRPHKGQIDTAKNIIAIVSDSGIIRAHKDCDKIQDAYSLRCTSQVHGASKDALRCTLETVDVEMNAVTDNPIIMSDTGEIISCGNFHGQPIALVMDYLKIAISELGNISERRISRMVDHNLSDLPAFLTAYPGVNSGYMIPQYTAASLVSENKVLTHPASVDSIPTSANQEDHVSMGTIAARQAREILENVRHVIAIEIMVALQGIDFLQPLQPGTALQALHAYLRKFVPFMHEDRMISPDIQMIYEKITDCSIVSLVEKSTGELFY